jgi:hypothetical protein
MKINKRVENKMSMFKLVLYLCLTNHTILESFGAINDVFLKFKELVNGLESLFQQKLMLTTGLSKDKKATKAMLARFAFRIGAAIHSYAFNSKNMTLMSAVHFTESQLRNLRDNDFIEVCKGYSSLAAVYATNIEGYNITASVLQTFTESIALFEGKNPMPAGAVKHGVTLTSEIELKEKEIREYLDNSLDMAMVNLPEEYESLVKDYFNSRKVTDYGIRHEKEPKEKPEELAYFACNLTDAEGNPLEEANLEIKSETDTYSDESDEYGDAYIEGIKTGKYLLTIMMLGKKTITEVIDFSTNDEISKEYILEDDVVPMIV